MFAGSDAAGRLRLVPVTFRVAAEFVDRYHRHLRPPAGQKFAVGVADGCDVLRGVAIAGRPTARMSDDGLTIEVTRCATDGAANACSMLYGAAVRAARALGYRAAITYTRADEPGASLRAANWSRVRDIPPAVGWSRTARPRPNSPARTAGKTLWRIEL